MTLTQAELRILYRILRGYEYVATMNHDEKALMVKIKEMIVVRHFNKDKN